MSSKERPTTPEAATIPEHAQPDPIARWEQATQAAIEETDSLTRFRTHRRLLGELPALLRAHGGTPTHFWDEPDHLADIVRGEIRRVQDALNDMRKVGYAVEAREEQELNDLGNKARAAAAEVKARLYLEKAAAVLEAGEEHAQDSCQTYCRWARASIQEAKDLGAPPVAYLDEHLVTLEQRLTK